MRSKQTLYNQAYEAVQNKEYAFARNLLSQLLKQEPDHLNGWLLASYAMNSRGGAIRCLERGLELDPTNAHAKNRLAKLQQRLPDPSPTLLLYLSAERPTVPPPPEELPEAAA